MKRLSAFYSRSSCLEKISRMLGNLRKQEMKSSADTWEPEAPSPGSVPKEKSAGKCRHHVKPRKPHYAEQFQFHINSFR